MIIKQNHKIGIIVALLTSVIYGIYPAATRAAYADGANVVFILLLTMLIRAIMMTSFCCLKRQPIFDSKKYTKKALLAGFCQAVSVIGVLGGVAFLPGPVVLIILFSHTLMLLFFMAYRKEVRLNYMTFGATLLALVGLALVLNVWETKTDANLIGIALAFMAAIATACRIYLFGQQMDVRSPAVVGAETFIVAFGFLLLLLFWRLPVAPETLAGYGWALLASLSLGIASFGTFYGIALLGSFRLSLFAKSEPIFTTLFSIWFLGEGLSLIQYAGMAVVIGSLVTYQIVSHKYSEV